MSSSDRVRYVLLIAFIPFLDNTIIPHIILKIYSSYLIYVILDDQIDMKFEADKDDEGNFKPSTVKLSFKNNLINKKLCTYMKALEIRENMINAKDNYSEEEYNASLQRINENIEEIKQHLLDDNMVVKKGTDRLTVKNYPN